MSRALALVDSSDESRQYEAQITASDPTLLETKLYVPRAQAGFVPRPRLLLALQQGAERRLSVIVAPAGFGKTTLLAAWLAECAGGAKTAGWVSLDAGDNEPTLFWSYFIRAVQKIHPGTGAEALALLRSPQPPPIESILTELINEVDAIDRDFVVILDDYHVIDAESVHSALAFLLDHLPRRMRVAIASRADPPLPLPRLRARGELAELRPVDLRFTLEEASVFLNQVMALDLSAADTATLEQRTEGWIAGLKLAALSMKARGDARGFVDAFSGANRYIADYLVEEVLQSEPGHVRRFLLGTAMLDRLSGSLCDAVMGVSGSQALLDDLERRNLFVVALDDSREWFRYHHLFADVLQKQALASDPAAAYASHRRASAWYEAQGALGDAVGHALAAQDIERTAGLLERTWPENNRSYESGRWLARVKTLPENTVRSRPVLGMAFAWGLLNSGELEAVEPRLRDVESALQAIADAGGRPGVATGMIVSDEKRLQSLPHELAAARVYLAQALGDVPGTLGHAKRALEKIPEGDHSARATAVALVALAHWGGGELETAHATFAAALDVMRVAGHELDVIRGIFVLGDIRVAQGRLREAVGHYEQGLRVANDAKFAAAETDELYIGLSEVYREWNELAAARKQLDAVARAVDSAAHKVARLRLGAALARVHQARGDFDAAVRVLDDAERHERRDPVPRVRPIPAMKARIRIAQGRMDDALAWARAAKVSVDDDLSYLREYEHVTLGRMVLVGSATAALPFLGRLQTAAQSGGRMGSVIEILILQSLGQQALGNQRGALDALAQALALAEPEGYLRVFLDEGTRMRDLLKTATARGLAGEYTRRVLAAFDAPVPLEAPVAGASAAAAVGIHPLTTRELEILRLIAGGLRNREIADELSISAATVKRHVANAYGKLGVGHRTEALARAAELDLL
jgi:LuxR family transcriptional regulator, maltose regulon positive regulatory protein